MITDVIGNIITTIFLLVILSYYILLIKRHKPPKGKEKFESITIVIPAHNEEKYIAACLKSVIAAKFNGKKEIIVIDDGSEDNTAKIAKSFPVKVISTKHSGKSKSMNLAISKSKSDLIAIVDGDSEIHEDSLTKAVPYLRSKKVSAVTSTIKVKNRKNLLGSWLHLEQLYHSLTRSLYVKLNVNIVTPGPLSIYKKKIIDDMGGFSHEGYAEDADVTIRMIQAGYKIEYSSKSYAETNMPLKPRGFYRQRRRYARGTLNIFRKYVRLNRAFLEIYTLPLLVFSYAQAVIMGLISVWNIYAGYDQWFLSKGVIFSGEAVMYFVRWLTFLGVIDWAKNIFIGATPFSMMVGISLAASLLTYPLYIVAIWRHDGLKGLWYLIPLFIMFPFWILVMIVYLVNIPYIFDNNQKNIWEK